MTSHLSFKPFLMSISAILAMTACGVTPSQDDANVNFIQSTDDRHAYLEQRDLNDEFLFGLSVIDTNSGSVNKKFFSSAMNFRIDPTPVRLSLSNGGSNSQLLVNNSQQLGSSPMFKFDIKRAANGRVEVDFGSAGNEIEIYNDIGGAFTASDPDASGWVTAGKPTVAKVMQDGDTIVTDVIHTISQTKKDKKGVSETRTGQIKIRLFLKRRSSIPKASTAQSVGQALSLNFGFFSSKWASSDKNLALPISRYVVNAANPNIIYYLKDVPAEFVPVATNALLSWNKVFGKDVVVVKMAPANVDAGDPRYNVVKWYDGLDNDIGFAGVAKGLVDPISGTMMSATLAINGKTVLNNYADIVKWGVEATKDGLKNMRARVGGVPLVKDAGENPVVPYLTDLTKNFRDYMTGYYSEVIAHEFGHALGLRHNFKGSTLLSADGESASVMDYAPRSQRNKYTKPGIYDEAAIKWAYLNQRPTRLLPFCTDENADSVPGGSDAEVVVDCNKGDFGTPEVYIPTALVDGAAFLAQTPLAMPETLIGSMEDLLKNGAKMIRLQRQLPANKRQEIVQGVSKAIQFVKNIQPVSGLTAEQTALVNTNLAKMKAYTTGLNFGSNAELQ